MKSFYILIFLLPLLSTQASFAAQKLRLEKDGEVRAEPDSGSETLEKAEKGSYYRGSTLTKNGFYKVILKNQTDSAKMGWISTEFVREVSTESTLFVAKKNSETVQKKSFRKRFYLESDYRFLFSQPLDLQTTLNVSPSVVLLSGPSFEAGFRLFNKVSTAIEFGLLSGGSEDSLTGKTYTLSGTLALLHVDYGLIQKEETRLWIGLSGGGAIGLSAAYLTSIAVPVSSAGFGLRMLFDWVFFDPFALCLKASFLIFTPGATLLDATTITKLGVTGPAIQGGLKWFF